MGRISRRNNVEEEIEINGRMGSYRQNIFLQRDTKRYGEKRDMLFFLFDDSNLHYTHYLGRAEEIRTSIKWGKFSLAPLGQMLSGRKETCLS